jgi:predicted ATPase with chaperone activity
LLPSRKTPLLFGSRYGRQVQDHQRQNKIPLQPNLNRESKFKSVKCSMSFSVRAYGRLVKVARTIAYLAGEENILSEHISEAIPYRSLDRQLW